MFQSKSKISFDNSEKKTKKQTKQKTIRTNQILRVTKFDEIGKADQKDSEQLACVWRHEGNAYPGCLCFELESFKS